jgi:hypothetical protein
MLVEVLTFDGCPHGEPALELARATVAELSVNAEVRRVSVTESQTEQSRFLGSPSIRVDGQDVEPGAQLRTDFSHSCRLYLTSAGPSALPEVAWIREKLVAGKTTRVNRG